jgi:hypothetical protein
MDEEVTLERCCGVPISRYSDLDGLTVRRLDVSQEWTESSVEDNVERLLAESEELKEMYS